MYLIIQIQCPWWINRSEIQTTHMKNEQYKSNRISSIATSKTHNAYLKQSTVHNKICKIILR